MDRLFKKAQRLIDGGELWQAKELLSGNIQTFGYKPELYEKYGQVLLQMGDLAEAGRFLFLSGKKKGEYEKPISIYLFRYTKKEPKFILGTFPRAARLQDIQSYPAEVGNTLVRLGLSKESFFWNPNQAVGFPSTWKDKASFFALILFLCFCFFCFGWGLINSMEWLFELLLG